MLKGNYFTRLSSYGNVFEGSDFFFVVVVVSSSLVLDRKSTILVLALHSCKWSIVS